MKVKSSNIHDIAYDEPTETLTVHFKDGSIYNYLSVPKVYYANLLSADSHGEFFAKTIRGKFTTRRLA